MDRAALTSVLADWGEPSYRARQAVQAQRAGAEGWDDVTVLPTALRSRLADALPFWTLTPEARVVSRDGTVKWGLRAADGAVVEAVLIAHAAGRRTICVSSQAGCALGCRFCATGAMGAGRDLTPAEILDQAVLAAAEASSQGARLTNAVFMGMGEPLQTLDAVLEACAAINSPEGLGLSARKIAISTVGWVPGIARLAEHPLPVRLAVSLHAADDATRSALMPINARYPIASLLAACTRYCDRTGRRVFIEYLLLDGVNDSTADARRLAGLLRDGRFHVNIIEYNPTEGPYRASPRDRREVFLKALADAGLEASVRRSRGADVGAACGQLAGIAETAAGAGGVRVAPRDANVTSREPHDGEGEAPPPRPPPPRDGLGARRRRADEGLVGDPGRPARGAGRPPAGERVHGLRRNDPDPGRRGRGQPLLRSAPGDPEALAEALRRALPGAEPLEVDPEDLAAAVAATGADPADDALVAAAIVAWESLLP